MIIILPSQNNLLLVIPDNAIDANVYAAIGLKCDKLYVDYNMLYNIFDWYTNNTVLARTYIVLYKLFSLLQLECTKA